MPWRRLHLENPGMMACHPQNCNSCQKGEFHLMLFLRQTIHVPRPVDKEKFKDSTFQSERDCSDKNQQLRTVKQKIKAGIFCEHCSWNVCDKITVSLSQWILTAEVRRIVSWQKLSYKIYKTPRREPWKYLTISLQKNSQT